MAASARQLWGTRSHALLLATAILCLAALAGGAVVGAKLIKGSAADKTLRGTKKRDVIKGGTGSEYIYARAGKDKVKSRPGNDDAYGGPGKDRVFGGAGDDVVAGGPGKDVLDGGPGRDYFNSTAEGLPIDGAGAAGNDTIRARDGQADVINCGPGYDIAFVDRVEDGVYDCEEVNSP